MHCLSVDKCSVAGDKTRATIIYCHLFGDVDLSASIRRLSMCSSQMADLSLLPRQYWLLMPYSGGSDRPGPRFPLTN